MPRITAGTHRISSLLWLTILCLWFATGSQAARAAPQATTTTLSVTAAGPTVTSVIQGTDVTLTATVVSGASPVTIGQVLFCNAAAKLCGPSNQIGTAQLTSGGIATIQFHPAVGNHTYKAIFLGTPHGATPYAASSSATENLSVNPNPTRDSSTSIFVSGWPGDYSLTATVVGNGLTPPTGTISFLDTTNGNAVLGTANLGATNVMTFTSKSVGPVNDYPIAVGDFNGDGNLDLALYDDTWGVTIYPGNGDGTFNAGYSRAIYGTSVRVGDFNDDGILDLAVAGGGSIYFFELQAYLGNGDGTFSTSPFSLTPYSFPPIVDIGAVGDFNGDGILDLALDNDGAVLIFPGNGDGTFTVPTNPSSIPGSVSAMGDFNGDGVMDLLVSSVSSMDLPTTTLYLGNGDGTFTAGASVLGPSGIAEVGVGDFNNDGKLDVIVAVKNGIEIYFGNGDGTFTAGPTTQAQISYPSVVGDFNGDGNLDILTSGTTLFGKGDGTFTVSSNNLPPYSFLNEVGDFNNDGIPDVPGYLTNNPLTSATALLTGLSIDGSTGGHAVEASYGGDSNYDPSVSSTIYLAAEPAAAAPVLSPAGGTFDSPQSVTLTDTSPGVLIYYTTDGSMPTPIVADLYDGPIGVSQPTTTIKAIAYVGNGNYAISPVTTASYIVNAAIDYLSPEYTSAGLGASILTVFGSGFTSNSVVYWGTAPLVTQYVSATELTVGISDSLTKNAGQYAVTVQNSAPGEPTTNSMLFEVDSASSPNAYPAFIVSSATVNAGETATYNLVLPSTATNVSVTCLNLPPQATCSYSSSSSSISIVTSSATPQGDYEITVVFTETLPASSSSLILFPFLLLPLVLLRRRLAAKGAWNVLGLAVVLLVGALAASGCGGSGGQGKSTSPQQVTASGGVELVVQ